MKHGLLAFGLALGLLGGTHAAFAEPGEDHPILGRFAPARLTHYDTVTYDAIRLPTGPADAAGEPESVLDLEGRVTWLGYTVPGDRSMLETLRNYEQAWEQGGLEILFSCQGSACGDARQMLRWLAGTPFNRGTTRQGTSPAHWIDWTRADEDLRVFVLAEGAAEQPAHVLLLITNHHYRDGRTKVGQIVVEGEAMMTDQVAIGVRDAGELQEALEADGRAVVDGIFFAFDSADLRPESAAALEQMARLLKDAPAIEVFIVGHTDGQGGFDYNQRLSEQRARSVVRALVESHGIAAERMEAKGVASLAPVASNATEQGREMNRRVELVLR